MRTTILPVICVSLLALLTTACATSDEPITSTGFESAPAGYSDALPPDQRPNLAEPGPLQKWLFGNSDEEETENSERIAQLERQLIQQQIHSEQRPVAAALPVSGPGPYVKLGLLTRGAVPPALLQQLETQLAALAPAYGSTLVSTGVVRAQLSGYGCDAAAVANCLGRLAVYPGVQTLAVIGARESGDGEQELTITLHDASHQISYPSQRMSLPAADGQVATTSLEAVAADILQRSRHVAALAPWSTRVFGQEAGQWYLAGGQRSGLEVGDVLEVRTGGRLIRSPTGSPAGWIPGELKGKLRLVSFLGEDNAVAELIEGQAPSQTDHLLLAQKK